MWDIYRVLLFIMQKKNVGERKIFSIIIMVRVGKMQWLPVILQASSTVSSGTIILVTRGHL